MEHLLAYCDQAIGLLNDLADKVEAGGSSPKIRPPPRVKVKNTEDPNKHRGVLRRINPWIAVVSATVVGTVAAALVLHYLFHLG